MILLPVARWRGEMCHRPEFLRRSGGMRWRRDRYQVEQRLPDRTTRKMAERAIVTTYSEPAWISIELNGSIQQALFKEERRKSSGALQMSSSGFDEVTLGPDR